MSTRTPHDKSGQQEGFGSLLSCVVRWALLCVVTRLGWFGIMPINSLYLHFDREMTNELLVGGRTFAPPHPGL
jgi:hypothetical protein